MGAGWSDCICFILVCNLHNYVITIKNSNALDLYFMHSYNSSTNVTLRDEGGGANIPSFIHS